MKKAISKILTVLLAISAVFAYNVDTPKADTDVDLSAASAILIEATTGRVLYEQNAYEQMPMASTTKIMTAILAIENCDICETVVVGQNASGVEGSSIWLSVGEKMALSDMLFGLMLASGNDAAVAIAEHVAGSVDAFVDMMNKKAKEIGAYNTNFVNPNGLPVDGHYTTAYDLALISAYAMQNAYFCEIVKTEYKSISWEGHEWNRVVKNKNQILWNYEGGNGIKTGYTDEAGRCLCAAANRDGLQLISVVLCAPDMFNDCMSLMDYGFENYASRLILEADELIGNVMVEKGIEEGFLVYTQCDVYYPLTDEEYKQIIKKVYIEETVAAPVTKGQQVGYIDIWIGNNKIYTVDLTAPVSIGENSYGFNLRRIINDWIQYRVLDM
ncbi:MAG: D-alanyl-D-alanine carboxypeptidase [Eubacteriales bacterium]|nr:D-alanyl-D-alanine carboxypeptidase [Eubacteriales bacterium]